MRTIFKNETMEVREHLDGGLLVYKNGSETPCMRIGSHEGKVVATGASSVPQLTVGVYLGMPALVF